MNQIRTEKKLLWEIIYRYKFECLVIAITAVVGLFYFAYGDGLSLTTYSVEFWDAIFSGRALEIPQLMVENSRNAPHAGNGFNGSTVLTTLPYALWNFPLWLTHTDSASVVTTPLCLAWSKLFLVICALVAGMVCYHIVEHITGNKQRAELAAIFFWGAGTLFISLGYSGQDEIVYLLVFLWGLYRFLCGKERTGLIWIGVSVSFAPFMLLPALLVLLSYTKNIMKIGIVSILMVVPDMLMNRLFPAVLPLQNDYFNWFFGRSMIGSGFGGVSIFAVVVLIVYALTYFRKYDSPHKRNQSLLYNLAILMGALCVLSWLHFYRYFLCVPFLLIAFLCKEKKNSTAINFGLILLTALEFCRTVGSLFFDGNCLHPGNITNAIKSSLGGAASFSFLEVLKLFAPGVDMLAPLFASIIVGLTILLLWFMREAGDENLISTCLPVNVISKMYVSIPLLVLVVFSILLFQVTAVTIPIEGDDVLAPAITNSTSLEQHYYSHNGERLQEVQVRTVTWGRTYPSNLQLRLDVIDKESQQVLGSAELAANTLLNNDYRSFQLEGLRLQPEKWYVFRLSASGVIDSEEQAIYLLRSDDGTSVPSEYYASIDDGVIEKEIIMPYNVVSRIVGVK